MNIAIRESKQRSLVGWLGLVGAVVFFGLFFLYVWLRIKPELIHHNDNPVFLTGVDFLKGFLARPGGPVEYVSLFFWQFYYCRWAGTLIITLTAAVICLATRGMMLAMGERRPGPAGCPSSRRPCCCSSTAVTATTPPQAARVILALGAVWLYARISPRLAVLRMGVFLVISAAVYYLAGGGYVLFAGLCGVLELLKRRSIILGILCFLSGPAAPYLLGAYSYQISHAQAYGALLPFSPTAAATIAPLWQGVEMRDWGLLRQLSAGAWLHLAFVMFFPLAAVWSCLQRQRSWVKKRLSAL